MRKCEGQLVMDRRYLMYNKEVRWLYSPVEHHYHNDRFKSRTVEIYYNRNESTRKETDTEKYRGRVSPEKSYFKNDYLCEIQLKLSAYLRHQQKFHLSG